jgi:hypothetical protein
MTRHAVASAALIGLSLAAPGAAAAATPVFGISDDPAFSDGRVEERRIVLDRAHPAGARIVRLTLNWSLVAPAGTDRPGGFDAADPSESGYRWGYVEEFVRDARRRGLDVLLTVARAPRWAEGPGRPEHGPPGSWRPQAQELADFMRAAAVRFSGEYPDPAAPADGPVEERRNLPRVRYWQIWDEPNAGQELRPLREAASRYRALVSAAARALHGVDRRNVVVTGGTAAGGRGTPPLPFWREVLSRKVDFDAYAHHPNAGNAPPGSRGGRRDVRVSTLSRLTRLVRRAGREGRVERGAWRRLWVTRLGWDTPPFADGGVSPARQARYLNLSMRLLASQSEADVVVWDGVRDSVAEEGSPFTDLASGLFFNRDNVDPRKDRPKPALASYRFPFVVERGGRAAVAWGVVPARAHRTVVVERRAGSRWRAVRRAASRRLGEFELRVPARPGRYRAVTGREVSAVWRLGSGGAR